MSGSFDRIRVLIVEDNAHMSTILRTILQGFGVRTIVEVRDAADAFETMRDVNPDFALVDYMLGDLNGLEFTRLVRTASDSANKYLPIIMVTARSDTHDVVAGLEAGADDYLTKPFEPKELSARIRALLRRSRSQNNDTVQMAFGELEVSPEEGVVMLRGEQVHLTKTEFKLLVELASGPGKVFSRETLLEKVWGYDYFGDGRLVDVHVRRLRTKIEPDPADPRYVVTVRGLGYKLVP